MYKGHSVYVELRVRKPGITHGWREGRPFLKPHTLHVNAEFLWLGRKVSRDVSLIHVHPITINKERIVRDAS